jgi:imidazoleglycerol-phosphate dehydratase
LGQALKESLGGRQDLERFGHAVVPMDESLAAATVDCSGRGHASISIEFVAGTVGGLPPSLLEHFFESFARAAELTLHLAAAGSDNHHVAEASFKALARALRQATRIDPSLRGVAASTKGSL